MKTKAKASKTNWKARAEKAERVTAAAAEFEYRYFMCFQTYTNREAGLRAESAKAVAFEDLRWALRDTGTIKRD